MDLKHHNNFMTPNDNLMFLESVIFRKPKNDTPTKQQTALQNLPQTYITWFPKNNVFRWHLIAQTPDIFQIKPKEHNKQLHRTNQTGKISQQAPKRHPKKTSKNIIKKTRRSIRVLPSKVSPDPLGLTFWTCNTHDGCIFTRKKPGRKPKQRIIWWQFDSPISEKTTLPRLWPQNTPSALTFRR